MLSSPYILDSAQTPGLPYSSVPMQYNMDQKLINTIKQLYAKASSVVIVQGLVDDWFHIPVGVLQGCLLSPTLFYQ